MGKGVKGEKEGRLSSFSPFPFHPLPSSPFHLLLSMSSALLKLKRFFLATLCLQITIKADASFAAFVYPFDAGL
jgi:uncharacterized membrane protein